MFGRLGEHIRSCDRRYTEQKEAYQSLESKTEERHRENQKAIESLSTDIDRNTRRILVGIIMILLSVLGYILAEAIHFKVTIQ
jgi:hypothetical protein